MPRALSAEPTRGGTGRWRSGVAIALIAAASFGLLGATGHVPAPPNLVFNGDFSQTVEGRPLGWDLIGTGASSDVQVESRRQGPTLVVTSRTRQVTGVVQRLRPAAEPFAKSPGQSYELSAEVKTDGLGPADRGAAIALLKDILPVNPVFEVNSYGRWRRVEVCIGLGGSWHFESIACTLGRAGWPSAGKALFRRVRLARVPGCTNPLAAQFMLPQGVYFFAEYQPPAHVSAHPRIDFLAFGLLVVGLLTSAIVGWRRLTGAP